MADNLTPKEAFRAHARNRIKQRYNVTFTDQDFKDTIKDIKSGRHFEQAMSGDDRVVIIMNVVKLGANVAVIYDKKVEEIVTVFTHRDSFKKIRKIKKAEAVEKQKVETAEKQKVEIVEKKVETAPLEVPVFDISECKRVNKRDRARARVALEHVGGEAVLEDDGTTSYVVEVVSPHKYRKTVKVMFDPEDGHPGFDLLHVVLDNEEERLLADGPRTLVKVPLEVIYLDDLGLRDRDALAAAKDEAAMKSPAPPPSKSPSSQEVKVPEGIVHKDKYKALHALRTVGGRFAGRYGQIDNFDVVITRKDHFEKIIRLELLGREVLSYQQIGRCRDMRETGFKPTIFEPSYRIDVYAAHARQKAGAEVDELLTRYGCLEEVEVDQRDDEQDEIIEAVESPLVQSASSPQTIFMTKLDENTARTIEKLETDFRGCMTDGVKDDRKTRELKNRLAAQGCIFVFDEAAQNYFAQEI